MDSYKGKEKVNSFREYLLYVTFFPKIASGPITLYSEVIGDLNNEENRTVNWSNLSKGAYLFAIGLFKKIVIADTLAIWVNNGFGSVEVIGVSAWITTIAYTLQIYFDFSGYSDMAVGIGKMLNVNLPNNFNSPYKSENISEFWRRWHSTLGRALTRLVYIPIGGSREGEGKLYRNLLIVFLISGIWHGASWNFILWGALHGIGSIVYRLWKKTGININRYIAIGINFLFINFTWVLFRAKDLSEAIVLYKNMFKWNISLSRIGELYYDSVLNLPLIIAAGIIIMTLIVLLYIIFSRKNSVKLSDEFTINNIVLVKTITLFYLSTICLTRVSQFIYFNF